MYKHELVKQKKQLQAMHLLLEWYEGSNNICDSICPLCRVIPDSLSCKGCVWVVRTGQTCDAYTSYHNTAAVTYLRGKRIDWWVEKRIPELKEWIKYYSKEK